MKLTIKGVVVYSIGIYASYECTRCGWTMNDLPFTSESPETIRADFNLVVDRHLRHCRGRKSVRYWIKLLGRRITQRFRRTQ